jgi:hypothetical protein
VGTYLTQVAYVLEGGYVLWAHISHPIGVGESELSVRRDGSSSNPFAKVDLKVEGPCLPLPGMPSHSGGRSSTSARVPGRVVRGGYGP